MNARHNFIAIGFGGRPIVHLKGHESQCFDMVRKEYIYCGARETTPEKFRTACEKYGFSCDISDDGIRVSREIDVMDVMGDGARRFTVASDSACVDKDGNVFVNDKPYTIMQQIEDSKPKSRKIEEEARKTLRECRLPKDLLQK